MALTKVTKSGITNNAIDADKLEDGTILAADITPGTITADKLNSTLDLSSKTVTLPNVSVTNAQLAGSIANAKLANSSLTINGSSVSLGSSISAGALDWQTVIVADGSTGTTGVAGRGYFIDTTSAAHTFTLPVSAAIGDTIGIVDYAGTFVTNALTIGRNGHNIQGVANNSLIGTNRASITLVYVDATKGWVYTNESNVADLGEPPQYVAATGGTVTTSGDFKIHTFTGDGCFVVSNAGFVLPAGGSDKVDYLVIAGGGGGGGYCSGGGGGAGGYRTTFPSPGCNAGAFPIAAQTYPITVGSGGAGQIGSVCSFTESANGSPSIFSTITSAGGGAGGSTASVSPSPVARAGKSGGSGGGGKIGACGGAGNTPPVSPPQGNAGGIGFDGGGPSVFNGGGGGGAAAVGSNASPTASGAGGAGLANSITASPVTYAGGGGGSSELGSPAAGGPGGGGAGNRGIGTAGVANTGGGGGAGGRGTPNLGGFRAGAAGGSGIVIIRYKFQ